MRVGNSPGAIRRFGRSSWQFQQTFQTPLKKLEPFVAVIMSGLGPVTAGCVIIDQYVFEPKSLKAMLAAQSLAPDFRHDCALTGSGDTETATLLRAALADWVDFLFLPEPKPFVIYADHDEFITFYANTKSDLNRVVLPLVKNGFERVEGWLREL